VFLAFSRALHSTLRTLTDNLHVPSPKAEKLRSNATPHVKAKVKIPSSPTWETSCVLPNGGVHRVSDGHPTLEQQCLTWLEFSKSSGNAKLAVILPHSKATVSKMKLNFLNYYLI
jgi:hypothetical protein